MVTQHDALQMRAAELSASFENGHESIVVECILDYPDKAHVAILAIMVCNQLDTDDAERLLSILMNRV